MNEETNKKHLSNLNKKNVGSNTFEYYIQKRKKTKNTAKAYRRHMERLNDAIFRGNLDINDKTQKPKEEDIDKMKDWLDKQVENGRYDKNSLIAYYSAIKMWLRYTGYMNNENEDYIKEEYLKNDEQKIRDYSQHILTWEEVKRMIFGIKQSKNIRRDKAIISMLWYTTRRNKEIRMLNLGDINFERKTLITILKGGKEFSQKIHEEAFDLLMDYINKERKPATELKKDIRGTGVKGEKKKETKLQLEKRKTDIQNALFLNGEGTFRLGTDALARMLKERAVEVGITEKNITPHNFRRSAITHFAKVNLPLDKIMSITGHKHKDTIIKHYIHYNDEDKQMIVEDVFDKIEKLSQGETLEDDNKPQEKPEQRIRQTDKDKEIQMLKLQLQVKEKELEIEKAKSHNPMYG